MFKQKINQVAYIAIISMFLFPNLAVAAPTGGMVTQGDAAISQNGSTTNINQSSQKAAINWQSFSVAPAETVNFNQPNASAITLNRVIGNETSVIQGAINANGKVYLVNSAGVVFTKGSQVNVGSLVATTLNITDTDFMNDNFAFSSDKDSPAAVINQGDIIAAQGGYVALIGGEVYNEGLIVAQMGTVSMNGAKKVTLNFNGDSLLSASIDEAALNALVSNKEAVIANGGLVIMTAKAAGDILSAQVNNGGLVQAQTIRDLNGGYSEGEILIYAYDGTANIAGTLDAGAPNGGNGGFIETSGDSVKIADDVMVTTLAENGQTGTWLIDPKDFYISADGDISGETLGTQLSSSNVEIKSANGATEGAGNIYVNDKVEWSANTTLTLTALNDIFINNAIKATGISAGLVMNYGGDYHILTKASYSGVEVVDPATGTAGAGALAAKADTSGGVYGSITLPGNNATLKINGKSYVLIRSMADFAKINQANGGGYYAIVADIDAGGTTYNDAIVSALGNMDTVWTPIDWDSQDDAYWDGIWSGAAEVDWVNYLVAIKTEIEPGILTGMGHTVDNLSIAASDASNVGLVGWVSSSSSIRDLGVTNANISSNSNTANIGVLVGSSDGGAFHQLYAGGTVKGGLYRGGIIGSGNPGARISSSFSNVNINSETRVEIPPGGSIEDLPSGQNVGGLAGYFAGDIISCHATGNVSGSNVGGLVGYLRNGSVYNSYAAGKVTATGRIGDEGGGLVGKWMDTTDDLSYTIQNCFATGNIVSYGGVCGGLIGYSHYMNAVVYNVYATGNITAVHSDDARNAAGGLIGKIDEGQVSYAHAIGNITVTGSGIEMVGGLIGYLGESDLSYAYATGNISTHSDNAIAKSIGGLVGYAGNNNMMKNKLANINNCYATGNVVGTINVGGLVGYLYGGNIYNSSASGNVTGQFGVGGLVGSGAGIQVKDGGGGRMDYTISGSSASGDVTVMYMGYPDTQYITGNGGGLIGIAGNYLTLADCTATGSINNTSNFNYVGGLIGQDSGRTSGYDGITYEGTNTYTDVKAIARQENWQSQQDNIQTVGEFTGNLIASAEKVTESNANIDTMADLNTEKQDIEGLPGNEKTGGNSGSGSGWGWGGNANGEPVTLATLGLQVFSATVKTIVTDEGEEYELEEDTMQ